MYRNWLNLRFWIQAAATALSNGYLKGFKTGDIYQGVLKHACVPTLNCYSCPGALFACPIGAMQVAIAGGGGIDPTAPHTFKARLSAIFTSTPFFVIGFLFLLGAIVGRAGCGWICPFGWFQELLHKIPSKKYKGPNFLKYAKYLILLIFVFALPALWMDQFGYGAPYFCKLICPAGTLQGGWLLPLLQPDLRMQLGKLFAWKSLILVAFMALMVFFRRPFCRWACPLGAFLAPMNKVSALRLKIDGNSCIECGACSKQCPVSLDVPREIDSLECIRCLECKNVCPKTCISIKGPGKFASINTAETTNSAPEA